MSAERVEWRDHPDWEAWMRENGGGDHSVAEVVDAFEAFAGVRLGYDQVVYFRRSRDLPRRRATPSADDRRVAPVGAVGRRHGRRYVKVADGRWEQLHVHNWEAVHGPVPDGHVLVFADGDADDCDESNLVAVPRDMLGVLAQGPRWHDRETLEAAVALARLRRGMVRAVATPRRCGVCGREFVPDCGNLAGNARAATCRDCLDRGLRAPDRVAVVEHACPVCGRVFEGPRKAVYCCGRCRGVAQRRRAKERRGQR